jgi:serine/threonine-protein kinase
LDREQPSRRVTLSPFYVDTNEVTNAEFAAWLNTDPNLLSIERDPEAENAKRWVRNRAGEVLADLLHEWHGKLQVGGLDFESDDPDDFRYRARPGKERDPVVSVTWDGARRYCESRGKRLPTEAEWEFAARGTKGRPYPWGEPFPACDAVVFGRDPAGRCVGLPAGPQPVTSAPFDTTAEGVHDLGGNVSEWVFDAFEGPFYPPCGECRDPLVEHAGSGPDSRILRGGSWGSTVLMRTTSRGRWQRTTSADTVGFRCAAGAPRQ